MTLQPPVPVLHEDYVKPTETCSAVIGTIKCAVKSGEIVKNLQKLYPLHELGHLKRIRSCVTSGCKVLDVIICRQDDRTKNGEPARPTCLVADSIFDDDLTSIRVIEIPKFPPKTRPQFEAAKAIWPTSFHEDKYITKLLSNNFFSKNDLELIEGYMMAAIDAGYTAGCRGMVPTGAVIVDPETNTILASAYDCTANGNPLLHAVMVCVDLVAKIQGGGALQLPCEMTQYGCLSLNVEKSPTGNSPVKCVVNELDPVEHENNYLYVKGQDGAKLNKNNMSEFETKSVSSIMKQPSTVCHDMVVEALSQEETAAENTTSLPSTEVTLSELNEERISENVHHNLKRKLESKEPIYLCTGYDLYTTHEPCIMCSMALVHSRIRRVFYGAEDTHLGGLGSVAKVHCQEGLNHHFQVFKNILMDKCKKLKPFS